jgi:hypothetical protein
MANTYIAIATNTVGAGGATNIEFTNIPQTYTDLVLKVSARDNRPTNIINYIEIFFNNSASTYSQKDLSTNGSTVYSTGNDLGANKPYTYGTASGATANTFGNSEIYIPNYTSSNAKSFSIDSITENNGTEVRYALSAASWSGTSAITSIKLLTYSGGSQLFQQHTTATLYGIKKS